jgi:hypothetical protein
MEFNLDDEFEALNNVLADLEKEGLCSSAKKSYMIDTSLFTPNDSIVQQIRQIAEAEDYLEIVSNAKVSFYNLYLLTFAAIAYCRNIRQASSFIG